MNSFYEYETRMNQIKNEIEKTAQGTWKYSPSTPRRQLNLQFVKIIILWLKKF
jgi:hypothetical protein